ncbi:MAG: hypothetical protein R3C62_20170 [Chloroflexota bacterium]
MNKAVSSLFHPRTLVGAFLLFLTFTVFLTPAQPKPTCHKMAHQ